MEIGQGLFRVGGFGPAVEVGVWGEILLVALVVVVVGV